MLVGYRHYDTKDVAPRFCFGHGLSYTTFAYEDLGPRRAMGTDVVVEVDVTNTGPRRGAEVVQVYVRRPRSGVERPDKELKAFEKVWLDPGRPLACACSFPSSPFATGTSPRAAGRSSGETPRSSSARRRATFGSRP